MRVGTLLTMVAVAFLFVGCSTATKPDEGLGAVIGSTDGNPPHTRAFPDSWGGRVDFASEYGFEDKVDDKDNGVKIDDKISTWSNRIHLRFDGPLGWEGSWLVTRLNYEYLANDWDDDDFYDDASFTSLDLWMFQGLSKTWAAGLLLRVNSNIESGADFGDGMGFFVAGGAVHKFSDTIFAGLGVFLSRSFDDDTYVLPVIQGKWLFADDWQLRVLGPRAAIRWQHTDKLVWKVGAEINSHRFLLDTGDNIALSDYRVPIFFGLEYGVADRFEVNARIGYDIYREITFGADSNDEFEFETDGAASLTGGFTWYF